MDIRLTRAVHPVILVGIFVGGSSFSLIPLLSVVYSP